MCELGQGDGHALEAPDGCECALGIGKFPDRDRARAADLRRARRQSREHRTKAADLIGCSRAAVTPNSEIRIPPPGTGCPHLSPQVRPDHETAYQRQTQVESIADTRLLD